VDNFGYSQNELVIYAVDWIEFGWLRWLKRGLPDLIEKDQLDFASYIDQINK